jgi:hypothetical protein
MEFKDRRRDIRNSALWTARIVLLLLTASYAAAQQSGTTLTADKTATGGWTRTFGWTINKSVTPDNWSLFAGDSGTSLYTVAVAKDAGTDVVSVSGAVTINNGGAVATENLMINDCIEWKIGAGQFQDLTCQLLDLSAHPVLDPGETYSYGYVINFTPIDGATYRNDAHITITNHAGWLPGGENCPGPDPCPFGPSPKADFALPGNPTLVNDTINVNDTNGESWSFSASGSQSYAMRFTCANAGQYDNTATIVETGQASSASVSVACYGLQVSKTAVTSFTRSYDWTIAKSVDQASLTVPDGQQGGVTYTVTATRGNPSDANFAVAGTITLTNPNPARNAVVVGVTDIMTGGITGAVNCGPGAILIGPGGSVNCSYTANLPDSSNRVNTATALLQNFDYVYDGSATTAGTTGFSGGAGVLFGDPTTVVDASADVTDSLTCPAGFTCTPAAFGPWHFDGSGSQTAAVTMTNNGVDCDTHFTLLNAAGLVEDTTGQQRGPATAATDIYTGPCATGCTLTIGYWKTHAGFTGNNADRVTQYLPIWLGTAGGAKSVQVTSAAQAVTLLSMSGDASNGINKLYAQELGAKLNIANGASGASIASTIASADAFLATHNASNWSGLSQTQKVTVLTWMTIFDSYNQGILGPGHCN